MIHRSLRGSDSSRVLVDEDEGGTVDDILDVEGSVENLGKIPGADRARGKATYPGLLGLNGARAEAHRLRTIALENIEPLGAAGRPLELIANFIVDRSQ